MKLIEDDQCPVSVCLSTTETIDHLFFDCPFSTRCFEKLCNWLHMHNYPTMIVSIINLKLKATCF